MPFTSISPGAIELQRGPTGNPGDDGSDAGILLRWDDDVANTDPGTGKIKANNADLSAATRLYVDKLNRAASSIAIYLLGLADSTSEPLKARIILTRTNDGAQASFDLTAVTDDAGYVRLTVSNHSGETSFTALDAISFQAERVGNAPDLSAVAVLASANTFTAANIFSSAAAAPTPLKLIATDNGATGPRLMLFHDSASPAPNDVTGVVSFQSRDSANNQQEFLRIQSVVIDETSGTEDSAFKLWTLQAGSFTSKIQIQKGVFIGSPTGGDKGAGTLNATAVYDDNSLLTCPALQEEYLRDGTIDLEKWDALVPDLVIPEVRETAPVLETVQEEVTRIVRDEAGDLVQTAETISVEKPVTFLEPVFDEQGNGLDAIEVPAMEVKIVPEVRIERTHVVAHLFQAMIDDGFDPRDPVSYVERMERDSALPGMPTESEWAQSKYSLGELGSRKWLAMEFLALAMRGLMQQHAALAARVATLGGSEA